MNTEKIQGLIQGLTAKSIKEMLVRSRLAGVGVLGVFVALAALVVATGPESEPLVRSEKAWPVSVKIAEPGEVAPTLIAFGRVESRQLANLKTSITALVDEMLVAEGDWVDKGEVLIVLRDEELVLVHKMAQAEHASRVAGWQTARTELELAQSITPHHRELKQIADAKLKRHLDLYNSSMVSNAVVDEARREASERAITLARHLADLKVLPRKIEQRDAAVTEAAALVAQAQIDLDQTRLRAPFSGRVIQTLVAPGDRSIPGTPLIQVANYDQLEIRTAIPADLGRKIRMQLESGARVAAIGTLDDQQVELVLDRLSGDVKPGQSGIDAFFVTAAGEQLDIGRVVNLAITLPAEQNVVVLPIQSLYERGRIYRVDGNRLEGLDVEQVGDYVDESGIYRVLVRSVQISAGDRVITTQLPRAITGLLVEPITAGFEQALASKIALKEGT